jgi:hypothetical protein
MSAQRIIIFLSALGCLAFALGVAWKALNGVETPGLLFGGFIGVVLICGLTAALRPDPKEGDSP